MYEETSEVLFDNITSFEDTCEECTELEPISKVTPESNEDKVKLAQQTHSNCSLSVILLALLRLGLHLSCYLITTHSVIIKADGTTSLKRIVRLNKMLKHPYVPNKVPVLSLVLAPLTVNNAFSVLSALGMILAVILSGLRLERRLSQDRPKRVIASILLISVCLLNTATDLTHSLGASFTHHHLLQANVGAPEALGFTLISIAVNMVQWILWYGGLEFQKSLLST